MWIIRIWATEFIKNWNNENRPWWLVSQDAEWNISASKFSWDWWWLFNLPSSGWSWWINQYYCWEDIDNWLVVSLVKYENLNTWTWNIFWKDTQNYVANSFYWQWILKEISLRIKKVWGDRNDVFIEIQWNNNWEPDWNAIISSSLLLKEDISTSFQEFKFTNLNFTPEEWDMYHIVIKATWIDVNDYFEIESWWADNSLWDLFVNDWEKWIMYSDRDLYLKLHWYLYLIKWWDNFVWILKSNWVIWKKAEVSISYDNLQNNLIAWNYYWYNKTTGAIQWWNLFKAISENELYLQSPKDAIDWKIQILNSEKNWIKTFKIISLSDDEILELWGDAVEVENEIITPTISTANIWWVEWWIIKINNQIQYNANSLMWNSEKSIASKKYVDEYQSYKLKWSCIMSTISSETIQIDYDWSPISKVVLAIAVKWDELDNYFYCEAYKEKNSSSMKGVWPIWIWNRSKWTWVCEWTTDDILTLKRSLWNNKIYLYVKVYESSNILQISSSKSWDWYYDWTLEINYMFIQ